jgi:hypothetical protein
MTRLGTRMGTCHFPTKADASAYYQPYGFGPKDIDCKIADGEIRIGPPPAREGERIVIRNDQPGNRYYYIEEVA